MSDIYHCAWYKATIKGHFVVSSVPNHPLLSFLPPTHQRSSKAQTDYFG